MEKALYPLKIIFVAFFLVALFSGSALAGYEGPSYQIIGTYYAYELGTDSEDILGIDDFGHEEIFGKDLDAYEDNFAITASPILYDADETVFDGKSGLYIEEEGFNDRALAYSLCAPDPDNANECKTSGDIDPHNIGVLAFNDVVNDLKGFNIGYEMPGGAEWEDEGHRIFRDFGGNYSDFDNPLFFGEFDYYDGDQTYTSDGHYRYGVAQRIFDGENDHAVFEFCDVRDEDECVADFSDEVWVDTEGVDADFLEIGDFSWMLFEEENVFEENRFYDNSKIVHGVTEYEEEGDWYRIDFEEGFSDIESFEEPPVVVASLNDEGDTGYVNVYDVDNSGFYLRVCSVSTGAECESTGTDPEKVSWLAVGGETDYEDISDSYGVPQEVRYNTKPEINVETEDGKTFETGEPVLNVSFRDFGEDPVSIRFYDENNSEMFSCDDPNCEGTEKVKEVIRSDAPESGESDDYERGDEGWIAMVLDGRYFGHGQTYEWSVYYGEYSGEHYDDCTNQDVSPLSCYFGAEDVSSTHDYLHDLTEWKENIIYDNYYEKGPFEFEVLIPIDIEDACEHTVIDYSGEEQDVPYSVGDEVFFEPGSIDYDGDIDSVKVCGDRMCNDILCSDFDSDFEECEAVIGEDWRSIQEYYLWVEADGLEMVSEERCYLLIDKEIFYTDKGSITVSFEQEDFVNLFISNEADITKTFEIKVGDIEDGSLDVFIEGMRSEGDSATIRVGPRSTEAVRVNFRAGFCGGTCEGEVDISVFDRTDAEEQTESLGATIKSSGSSVAADGVSIIHLVFTVFLALIIFFFLSD